MKVCCHHLRGTNIPFVLCYPDKLQCHLIKIKTTASITPYFLTKLAAGVIILRSSCGFFS